MTHATQHKTGRTDSESDVTIGALEDGFRPPTDPADWGRVYSVVTGEACPRCGTAIAALLGPTSAVDDVAAELQAEFGEELPDTWADGYAEPVYLFCDRPTCQWHGVAEWADVRPVLESWIRGDAPTWRDRVERRTA